MYSPKQQKTPPSVRFLPSDFRLHVTVIYRDSVVREVTISSPEGCHLTPCAPDEKHYPQAGSAEVVPLPVESLSPPRRTDDGPPSPPSTLERGVLLWMGHDGLYARRLCQSRVYWQRGSSQYADKPSKLEREVNYKLLHTQDCFAGEMIPYGPLDPDRCAANILLKYGRNSFSVVKSTFFSVFCDNMRNMTQTRFKQSLAITHRNEERPAVTGSQQGVGIDS